MKNALGEVDDVLQDAFSIDADLNRMDAPTASGPVKAKEGISIPLARCGK